MDKLSGFASKLGGKSDQQSSNSDSHSGGTSGSSGQEDYLDKGLDAVQKKFGGDPAKTRDTNEKITDTIREQFESKTGKTVPEKFSN